MSVRPSVCLSMADCRKSAPAGLLLWARRTGDIDGLLQQRRPNAGSATLSAYVAAEHRLVIIACIIEISSWSSTSGKRCPRPPVVPYGRHNASAGRTSFPLGTQLVYRCRRGYSMEGPFRVICVDEGRWADPQITCTRNYLRLLISTSRGFLISFSLINYLPRCSSAKLTHTT